MAKIRVTIWNENVHETADSAFGAYIRTFYPNGIHNALKEELASDDLEITAVSLDMPNQGITDELLANTDVLVWWGHCAHAKVEDALVEKIHTRILEGMGLIVLHSGHYSKIFRRLTGTSNSLRWRECGEKELVWVVDKQHPITRDVPDYVEVPNTEMYGEPFDIPTPDELIYLGWFKGGEVLRSGFVVKRGRGKMFYLNCGHETYPVYKNEGVRKILINASNYVKPNAPILDKLDCPHITEFSIK